ncbi:MAG: hydroxymethylbilane synthase, partial [Chitinophagaceae bacterium]
GCSTPVSALAFVQGDELIFEGSILSIDGGQKAEIHKRIKLGNTEHSGVNSANELLANGGKEIAATIMHER